MLRVARTLQAARFVRNTSRQQHTTARDNTSFSSQALLLGGLGLSSLATFAHNAHCEESRGSSSTTLSLDSERFFETPAAAQSLVTHVSCATYKANAPIEDCFAVQTTAANGDVYAAVFDGHGGWQVSAFVSKTLIANVEKELAALEPAANGSADATGSSSSPEQVAAAIQRAFTRTDRELMARVAPAFELGFGAVARVGSCALLAVVHDGYLHVANAGDSRAVLGKLATDSSAPLLAVPLSRDQNAMVQFEQEKLMREHPGELDAFLCRELESCYVKGALQPTRAFGDFSLKFSEFNGPSYDTNGGDRSAGHHTPAPFSPPYITAVPELKSIKLHDGSEAKADRFLILGSDGVWDFLSNEQAVECVREQVALGDFKNAGRSVVEKTLQHAAAKHRIAYQELLELAPGKPRRPVHDDTTVIVLFF